MSENNNTLLAPYNGQLMRFVVDEDGSWYSIMDEGAESEEELKE